METATSPAALHAAAPAALHAEPEWLKHAADELGYAWARVAWQKAAAQPGAWFYHAKADRVVEAWPRWFKLTVDHFFGKPFHLAPWQAVIVRLLVGWKIPEEIVDVETGNPTTVHVRLFRRLRLWVPRKNGKTEFLAALGLLFFVREKVHGAEGYVFAKDEAQAYVPFNKMKAMIALDSDLAKDTQLFKRSIYVPEIAGSIELLSGAEGGKHGKSPTVILGDEMHEWTSRVILDTLRQGTGARLQPIELCASTAGLSTNATGTELYDETVAILDGRNEDASTLAVVFAADPDDDPFDEATWKKANPSLGISPTLRFLRDEAAAAKGNPRKEAAFRCYHLNQWIDAAVRWLPLTKWDACAGDNQAWKTRREDMRGRSCVVALDVSSTQDITALHFRFEPDGDGIIRSLSRFWIPEDTLAAREKADKNPWRRWVQIGAIETTPGDCVDQSFVAKAIRDSLEEFDVTSIGFDPWNARKLVGDLQNEGVDADLFVEMRQGILTLGEPSKIFEAAIFAGRYDHGGHPVLRWMAGHTVVRFDENLNFMPARKRSKDKIDGIVCCVMCEGLAMPDDEGPIVTGADAMRAA